MKAIKQDHRIVTRFGVGEVSDLSLVIRVGLPEQGTYELGPE